MSDQGEREDCTDPFDRLDFARLARHEKLLEVYRQLPLPELLADINILMQLVGAKLALREQQEQQQAKPLDISGIPAAVPDEEGLTWRPGEYLGISREQPVLSGPQPSITCPFCGFLSYNPNDITQRYCGACHKFQEPERP